MNKKIINKIKLFDKLASKSLVIKEAGTPPWWLPLTALSPGLGLPAAGIYGAYQASQVSDEEKKEAFLTAKRAIIDRIKTSYNNLLSYAPTEKDFKKNKENGLIQGNAKTREQYIAPFMTDDRIESDIKGDSDIKKAVKAGYLTTSDVDKLIEIAKNFRNEILEDLRRKTKEEVSPSPKLPKSPLTSTPENPFSGSYVKRKQSDFSEKEISKDERQTADGQAKAFADDTWNSLKKARDSGQEGIKIAKTRIQDIINQSNKEVNNNNLPAFTRFKHLRISQILSAYLKTL